MDKEFVELGELLDQLFPGQQQQCDDDSQWHWDTNSAENLVLEKTVRFKDDGFCVQFHPLFSYGTAAVWGECALDESVRAYWEVAVEEVYGSSMMFGVGTRDALQSVQFSFVDLLGGVGRYGDQTYGLSHKGFVCHGCVTRPFCAQFHVAGDDDGPRRRCTVGTLFDGPSASIGFSLDGKWLGWAFHRTVTMDGRVYYPMVSSTTQRSDFTLLRHRQRKTRTPKALRRKCMDAIVGQILRIRRTELPSLGTLGLPKGLECELWQGWCSKVMGAHEQNGASTTASAIEQNALEERCVLTINKHGPLNFVFNNTAAIPRHVSQNVPPTGSSRRTKSGGAIATRPLLGD